MDAQNAVEPIPSKPPASPKRQGSEPDQPPSSTVTGSPGKAKQSPPEKQSKSSAASTKGAHGDDDDAGPDGNSDAETIVLPGKDGHSPSKVRKIKNEDKSDGGGDQGDSISSRKSLKSKLDRPSDRGDRSDKADKPEKSAQSSSNPPSDTAGSSLFGQGKKSHEKPRSKDGSSGLSSVPTSPPPHPRRRSSHPPSDSDSEAVPPSKSPKVSTKDKPRVDRLVSHKRKATRAESEDEAESRKVRRQRTSGSGLNASRSHRDRDRDRDHKDHRDSNASSSKAHHDARPALSNKSASPPARAHRRSTSTQLPGNSSNGLSHKKKRVPAPLRSTDYHSDESSASGSPHPRSSKLRSLTTPATTESTTSPAKLAPHKKHLDAHGQTFLARACARGEYDVAKQRLEERPEDIDVADYAGNTPLQIASINGCEDIVKLLIEAGCSLDCVNYDKDTPLLDAVDNGHLDVIKLLLAAGVNPRKANAYGQEPIDRVQDDQDNAAEMKKALQDARARMGERRRTSEDHHPQDHTDARSSHGPESPRQSPGAPLMTPAASSSRRAGTVRSTKTSNHLLYMPMDDKTLRSAAARGDEETVTRILQVRDTFDDPESMVAAARGGHDIVMQLLLALGRANPDPGPISSNEFSTPMLAAIGQENIKVVRLLLDQTDFDPTRRFKGEAYYEVARRRRGPNWMDEEHMLKNAYDEYRKTHKDSSKTKSPNRREQEREARRNRAEPKEDASAPHKRKASSPSKENVREGKKPGLTKASTTSPKEKRRSSSFANQHDDQSSPKRGPGRPRKEDRVPAIAISDREASPAASKHSNKPKRTESDIAVSSEGESMKPRRKLVSRKELKGEREKKRRASMTSNTSSLKEPSSPREPKQDEPHEKPQKLDKYHDRTKALKRDESREKLSLSGDGSGKRHRLSATPPRHGSEKDGSEGPVKRRRLDVVESKEKRQKTSPAPDERPSKSTSSRDTASSSRSTSKSGLKDRGDNERRASPMARKSHEHGKPAKLASEKSIHVKSEDQDVEMPDAPKSTDNGPDRAVQEREKDEAKQRQAELEAQAQEAKKQEEERERKRKEDEEREREQARRRKEEEETARRAEEERKQREEAERKRKEEEEAAARKQKEEEERRLREEAEKKRLEEEAKRKREEEERRLKEEEARKKREEEERLRREQLEREAAEEARRKKEEERKEQERKERAMREEMERRRAAREAERAAKEAEQRLEQERIRLAKLPPLLRWLDGSPNPKIPEVACKFSMTQGVRYDCIRPAATGTQDGREQWLLNTQVALLLGEKDLELSRCK